MVSYQEDRLARVMLCVPVRSGVSTRCFPLPPWSPKALTPLLFHSINPSLSHSITLSFHHFVICCEKYVTFLNILSYEWITNWHRIGSDTNTKPEQMQISNVSLFYTHACSVDQHCYSCHSVTRSLLNVSVSSTTGLFLRHSKDLFFFAIPSGALENDYSPVVLGWWNLRFLHHPEYPSVTISAGTRW